MMNTQLKPEDLGTDTLTGFDGKEISPGIFIIGDVHYYDSPYKYKDGDSQLVLPHICGEWRCLADVCGMLCVISVRPKKLTTKEEGGE